MGANHRDSTVAVILKTKVLNREGLALLTSRGLTRLFRAAGEKRGGGREREGGREGGSVRERYRQR